MGEDSSISFFFRKDSELEKFMTQLNKNTLTNLIQKHTHKTDKIHTHLKLSN